MIAIDLNADLGEGIGDDTGLLAVVTSASIACGGHAGNADTMRAALRAARAHGVRVGAHPGFADREHFGRRRLDLPPRDIAAQVGEQVDTLAGIARAEGVPLAYVKLHGALANMAAEDQALAEAVFGPVLDRYPGMAVMALEHSAQQRAAEALGVEAIAEAYADRAYLPDGLLAPREMAGSVIHDGAAVVARCLRLAQSGEIVAMDGTVLRSGARSVCLHGDTPGALALARGIRAALSGKIHGR